MQSDPPAGVSASPVSENVMTWYYLPSNLVPLFCHLSFVNHSYLRRNAVIIGPADTPFEDGTFKLVMQFDENYPNKPPQVKFISRMVNLLIAFVRVAAEIVVPSECVYFGRSLS